LDSADVGEFLDQKWPNFGQSLAVNTVRMCNDNIVTWRRVARSSVPKFTVTQKEVCVVKHETRVVMTQNACGKTRVW